MGYSISPSKRRPPSPPFSFYFRHIHSFSHSITSHSLNVPKPLQHLSIHSSTQFFRHTHSFSHFPFAQRAQTTSTPFNPLFHSIFQAHPLFLSQLHSFFFIARLGCHQKVTRNPFPHTHHNRSGTPWYSRRGATRKGSRSDLSVIIGLVTPGTPNKTPLQDKNFQLSPTGGPDPPSYRVESVSLPTLYQSYYPPC